jgi:prepilin-type N-terminal cleavage/methylation domain-containing protein/prepilin-type processing-associated H-X9-DG protein
MRSAVTFLNPELPSGAALARRAAPRAFTLIELLVVAAIIAVLLTLLLPVLSEARGRMKTLKCASSMRSIGLEFQWFVEGDNPGGHGDSSALGPNRFHISDYLDYMYRLDEFWNLPGNSTLPLYAGQEPMMCPAGPGQLTKRAGFPCGRQALRPPGNITLAANMRLHRAQRQLGDQQLLIPAASTYLRSDILQHPYVPLILDVDGERAFQAGVEPFYTAPPLPDDEGPYGTKPYWHPGRRHDDAVNVVFVGGHVLTSRQPAQEPWDWAYQGEFIGARP